jgi:hypothetical protein
MNHGIPTPEAVDLSHQGRRIDGTLALSAATEGLVAEYGAACPASPSITHSARRLPPRYRRPGIRFCTREIATAQASLGSQTTSRAATQARRPSRRSLA